MKISGPESHNIIKKFLTKSLIISSKIFHTIIVNPFNGDIMDSCSIAISTEEDSFTGENMVEIHFSSYEKYEEFADILINHKYAYLSDVNELLLRKKSNCATNNINMKSSFLKSSLHNLNDSKLISNFLRGNIEDKYIEWNKQISLFINKLSEYYDSNHNIECENASLDKLSESIDFLKKEVLAHVTDVSRLNELYYENKKSNRISKSITEKNISNINNCNIYPIQSLNTPSNDNESN
jgi:hypothetical protein